MDNVLNTYIYEIKKGTKPLALVTVLSDKTEGCIEKIRKSQLSYCVQKNGNKSNIFFGNIHCVEIIQGFLHKDLSKLNPAEDFILGILLGYSRIEQCKRYLNKLNLHPIG